ncbi:dienelactone hydrolase family protein [Actinomycetospora termitidis]|uniref:Dienelactone hydrolase family protein n=1 Tax=Actinomycetospora termitidis TaxID=3053470 RepID=A0ABT7M9G7_9PSEU|nr:dienelactone hydrolase family protein [Actinomycetospora sp. Odt1-22]MDL5157295.1 dienelactone hydrolase family protein [Actinomycetospora sp. Odt1-22]
MTRTELVVETPDGPCRATLHTPEGAGPWPGVLYYPDAGGVRETIAGMADRLAAHGFAALLPDIYHRTPYPPFDTSTLFGDPEEFARLTELARTLTPERVAADAGAYVDALTARPEVADGGVGAVGYCFGGSMAFRAAAERPALVAAVATFHGGGLATPDVPTSPHRLLGSVRAAVYVAAATDDDSFDAEAHERLRAAFDDTGVPGTIETYPAAHGFAVPDNPTHDDDADRRHLDAMVTFLREHLTR